MCLMASIMPWPTEAVSGLPSMVTMPSLTFTVKRPGSQRKRGDLPDGDHVRAHHVLTVAFTARGRTLIPQAVRDIESADAEFFGRLGVEDLAAYQVLTAALITANSRAD